MTYKKVVILGSNSFAGANFVKRALSEGYQVLGFNRSNEGHLMFLPYNNVLNKKNYKFIQADINKNFNEIIDNINIFKPNIIIDFLGQGMVAESWKNPIQWYTTNLISKIKLIEEIKLKTWLEKYIRVSTPEVYGSSEHLLLETSMYNPSTPYAISHTAIDMNLAIYFQQYNFPVIINRFANFYGPGQQLYRIIPRTIIYALMKKKLKLDGGGKSIRAFIYADDVSDALIKTINTGKIGEIYHFSPNSFISIRELVEKICIKMNIEFNSFVEVVNDRPGKDHAYLMDSKKSRVELFWNDNISIDDGINHTYSWIKQNINDIKNLPLDYVHKP